MKFFRLFTICLNCSTIFCNNYKKKLIKYMDVRIYIFLKFNLLFKSATFLFFNKKDHSRAPPIIFLILKL